MKDLNTATFIYNRFGKKDKMRVLNKLCGQDPNNPEIIITTRILIKNLEDEVLAKTLKNINKSKHFQTPSLVHLEHNLKYLTDDLLDSYNKVMDLVNTKLVDLDNKPLVKAETLAFYLLQGKLPYIINKQISKRDYLYINLD